ncbi:hypothetical protein [Legionella jordanis]|uniref:Uncharacterized protein n=1 Tax=Legionella jordanis TaxID=456 RepID=A0A0W0VER9_9GAMM|nr:hypothetical protein [Legionella jordanis]KTD18381.1 hypothetical protein Ljor_2687 [Legionella jordanis]RMX05291.1 hypothetical protein EAW55_01105 [Legionella jordanis]RMX20858.1 hypothetical protein EAS68_05940 [Legionella jordanis]VEH13273.1 Uncharacterized conserved protein [Legionella jordanis]HAT8713621.1 hypothetical protein [Legionella jordanis]
MKLPPLPNLLAYQNERVIQYYCQRYSVSLQKAESIFTDLLGWMWINLYRKNRGRDSFLFGPLLPLDDMWHAFILHTKDYVEFCKLYFEGYFHHHIEPFGLEHVLDEEELADFLKDCLAFLGEDWLLRHFSSVIPKQ